MFIIFLISVYTTANNFKMFELLKTLPFIKYVDRPMGRFLHSIDLVLVDENNIDDLKEILDKNNWYIERGRDRSFTITQKYVDDAKIDASYKDGILHIAVGKKMIDSPKAVKTISVK